MANKPTIYGFDDAGCKWQTEHKDNLYPKDQLYTKTQVYTKDQVYTKAEIDNLLNKIKYELPLYYGAPSSSSTWPVPVSSGIAPILSRSSQDNKIVINASRLDATYYYKLLTSNHIVATPTDNNGILTFDGNGVAYLDISQGSIAQGDYRGFSIVGYKDGHKGSELWAIFETN